MGHAERVDGMGLGFGRQVDQQLARRARVNGGAPEINYVKEGIYRTGSRLICPPILPNYRACVVCLPEVGGDLRTGLSVRGISHAY